jgi:hypothetical protein
MKNTFAQHKWFAGVALVILLACFWVTVVMIQPLSTHAFTLIEMPTFVFNPVEISATQTAEVCAVNWGDGSLNILIGLLQPSDTTKSAAPIQALEVKAHTSMCVALPAIQKPAVTAAAPNFILPFLAVRAPNSFNRGTRNFTVSLKVLDGGSTKFVVPATFLPAVQLPTS